MRTITLKSDESFYELVNRLAQKLHISKSQLIRDAVHHYANLLRKEQLRHALQQESLMSKKVYNKEMKEWEITLLDGLDNDPSR